MLLESVVRRGGRRGRRTSRALKELDERWLEATDPSWWPVSHGQWWLARHPYR